MKKIFKIVILFLFFSGNLSTQAQEILQQTEPQKRSFFTFNISAPLVSYAPRWDLGYYYKINDKFIVGAEFGYGNYNTAINFDMDYDLLEKDYQLFEIRPEVMYVMNSNRKTKRFFSAEIYYINHKDQFYTDRYEDGSKRYRFDQADYSRTKYGLNLNYGLIINFTKSFGIIPKIGFGWRFRDVKYSNLVNVTELSDNEGENQVPNVEGFINESGKKSGANFVFDVKLFFKI